MERIRHKFAALHALEDRKLHSLLESRYQLDSFFLIKLYINSAFRTSSFVCVDLRVPAPYIRRSSFIYVCCSSINYSARWVSAVNVFYIDFDVFATRTVYLNLFVLS
jgi:hypothetical protein